MNNSERVCLIVDRAAALSQYTLALLRKVYGGFDCDEEPTQQDVKDQTLGMTKAELVKAILCLEFDEETDPNSEWGRI